MSLWSALVFFLLINKKLNIINGQIFNVFKINIHELTHLSIMHNKIIPKTFIQI
jgi:uncharacterized protein YfkK (UPF0435 family)